MTVVNQVNENEDKKIKIFIRKQIVLNNIILKNFMRIKN